MDLSAQIINAIINSSPLIIVGALYFVRLEKKLTEINIDLQWIKKIINPCLPTSEDDTV